jgi:acyl-coenzyme A synthetase/AMP-(fatty) acid ligase/acyl carrier protein
MAHLGDFINQHKVTTAWMTAGLFDVFTSLYREPLEHLSALIVGGDTVNSYTVKDIKHNNPDLTIINGYGPTENTTFSCTHSMASLAIIPQELPIGSPLSNRQACILNEQLSLVPIGIIGELHVGGAGLARGYLNQPDLTDERFIANPFFDEAKTEGLSTSQRLYKTGDLVRWLPNGTLEFLGRIDHQVKIRGFRIELGEIEHQLASQEGVNDAIVLAKTNEQGDKQLVAYVTTPLASTFIDETEQSQQARTQYIDVLRQSLLTTLPDYMVPAMFVLLENFPLTTNGKVDRKALPDADMASQQQVYVAPSTETEKALCEIWQDLLSIEVDAISVTSNFFNIGGDSLLIVRLASKITDQFELTLDIKGLFELSDIQSIAIFIDRYKSLQTIERSKKHVKILDSGVL